MKAWAAWTTGSTAMLGSLADTALDLLASVITLIGVRVASRPADDDHRFGHGKAEAVVALFQVVIISVSALGIGWRAIERLRSGAVTTEAESGIAVSAIAILATLALITYQRMVVRRTGSVAIKADSLHYSSDLALNSAVIVALLLESKAGLHGADPLFGVLIAGWLLYGAGTTASHVLEQLMDKEWPAERKKQFIEVVMRIPEAAGIHDLRTRTSGAHEFAQFHLWMDGKLTLTEVHAVMDRVEAELAKEFPGVEILIHPDPEGHKDELGYTPSESVT
ncbi:cation diffusion facilitator family transporter [Sphingomonas lacunae]|uniref:Cation diffusion facilitator family transporter n=2 Tax=Sphingomonas lacunae TaxID=2698828 RepID=A0A6M4B282_9SPHN|nr:cation diffusion facilitator family transporter [Sphingomonas lacunae]